MLNRDAHIRTLPWNSGWVVDCDSWAPRLSCPEKSSLIWGLNYSYFPDTELLPRFQSGSSHSPHFIMKFERVLTSWCWQKHGFKITVWLETRWLWTLVTRLETFIWRSDPAVVLVTKSWTSDWWFGAYVWKRVWSPTPGLGIGYSERPSARHLKSLCLGSLCEKAPKVYLHQHAPHPQTHTWLWTPEQLWMQNREIGGMSWLCPAHIRQVPGSQLRVLAVAGVPFGSSKGEDMMFSGDSTALPSLGEAVPRAGSSVLREKLVQPPLSSGYWRTQFLCLAAGTNHQQITSWEISFPKTLQTTSELLLSFQDTHGQPLLASLCYCSLE